MSHIHPRVLAIIYRYLLPESIRIPYDICPLEYNEVKRVLPNKFSAINFTHVWVMIFHFRILPILFCDFFFQFHSEHSFSIVPALLTFLNELTHQAYTACFSIYNPTPLDSTNIHRDVKYFNKH